MSTAIDDMTPIKMPKISRVLVTWLAELVGVNGTVASQSSAVVVDLFDNGFGQ